MEEKKLTSIMDSIQKKVGDELSATIQDDLGLLITENANVLTALQEKEKQISDLTSRNDKLIQANANLFAQIPTAEKGFENDRKESEPMKEYDFFDGFDSNGNFKK